MTRHRVADAGRVKHANAFDRALQELQRRADSPHVQKILVRVDDLLSRGLRNQAHALVNPRSRYEWLQRRLYPYGYEVYRNAPGDGVTRYRFFETVGEPKDEHRGYHSGFGMKTVLGMGKAEVFGEELMHAADVAQADADEMAWRAETGETGPSWRGPGSGR